MTIFYMTEDDMIECDAVSKFIQCYQNTDNKQQLIDVIWEFYKVSNQNQEACFLYTISNLWAGGDPWGGKKIFDKRLKFKFINDYPVEIIDDEENELDEDEFDIDNDINKPKRP